MKELKSLLCQYLRTKETDFYLLPAYSIDTCNKEVDKLYKLSKIFSKISLTKICMDYLNFLFLCLDSRPTSSTDFRYLEGETLIVIFPSLLTLLTSNCKLFITGSYYIETSPLICSLNQWTGFFMLGTSVVKEVKSLTIIRI